MLGRLQEVDANHRLAELSISPGIRDFLRSMDLQSRAFPGQNLVSHVSGRLHEVHVRLLLQTLLDDFHVQQPEKPAAKANPGPRSFRLEFKLGSLIESFVSASRRLPKSWPSDGYRRSTTMPLRGL